MKISRSVKTLCTDFLLFGKCAPKVGHFLNPVVQNFVAIKLEQGTVLQRANTIRVKITFHHQSLNISSNQKNHNRIKSYFFTA